MKQVSCRSGSQPLPKLWGQGQVALFGGLLLLLDRRQARVDCTGPMGFTARVTLHPWPAGSEVMEPFVVDSPDDFSASSTARACPSPWRLGFLFGGGLVAAAGVSYDYVASTSHNGRLDAGDFVGPVALSLATAGIVTGLAFDPYQTGAEARIETPTRDGWLWGLALVGAGLTSASATAASLQRTGSAHRFMGSNAVLPVGIAAATVTTSALLFLALSGGDNGIEPR